MKRCGLFLVLSIAILAGLAACGSGGSDSGDDPSGSAIALGRLSNNAQAAAVTDAAVCPVVIVSINGSPVPLEFGDPVTF